ncbi:PEGA domain-containing protein [Oxalobacteraceae sp. CFBP 13708]|nr:PEGA domain-containing protein [Oxalobacteraceae sp. CFBP 13708]
MNPSTPPQQLDGRTVREIVEYNHEMVSEPWCRRIIRQVLQSLEVQYGMNVPHRRITPDSLHILEAGDPMLVPGYSELPDTAVPADYEARDLYDLAAVMHYAISQELAPVAQLRTLGLTEYSESFLAALDRCLSPDSAVRPQTIEQMRGLLGIAVIAPKPAISLPPIDDEPMAPVVPLPMPTPAPTPAPPPTPEPVRAPEPVAVPKPAPAAPPPPPAPGPLPMRAAANASTPMAPAPTPVAARRNKTRWPLIVGTILLILAALAALFALTRQADLSGMKDMSALPETPEATVPAAAPAPLVTLAEEPPRLDAPVIDETAPRATTATPPPAKPDVAVPPTAVRLAPQGTPPEAAVAGTTYKLLIQPWGTIVVDGVERGATPPLKHITLPPGEHTIRIVNPGFPEHTVTVQSVEGQSGTIELDFTEEKTP